ncbi:hypothetical protein PRZ48_010571 [Zasmidium cellare]|uniref:Uncharacterized protein n=1 Tax=Zasmidium cellare TaxID=395010 RepID=A0ABR0E9K5_ZASCE|nr:hypothetical protein PRZ48_010571 [Zasmidium cellare]
MAKTGSLIPLIILFVVAAIGAFVAYHIYAWSNELSERGKKHMEKKNMAFTKDGGLRVGVKEMKDEKYADKTQNVLVNVWNNASLPNYQSRLGWNSTQKQPGDSSKPRNGTSSPRPSASRSSTTASNPAANLSAPEGRPSARRTPSTPGAFD